jgi:hypothetical protein
MLRAFLLVLRKSKKNTPVTWTGVFGFAGKQEGVGVASGGFISIFET